MRKFNVRESETLKFQFWAKCGSVSNTQVPLYRIHNRAENASDASDASVYNTGHFWTQLHPS